MVKVAIVTNGPYGERAFQTIKEEFKTSFIQLQPPTSMFIEEIDLSSEDVGEIEASNILITYTTHPDLTLELVERFTCSVDWIIVAAWSGEGFKNQLETFDNVIFPYVMCELEEIGDPVFDEFASRIGKPEVELEIENGELKDITVLRCAPCGSTNFVAEFLIDKYQDEKPDLQDLPREAGLRLQHYPCRSAKLRLFSPEECKKDKASMIHRDAFKAAIKENKRNK